MRHLLNALRYQVHLTKCGRLQSWEAEKGYWRCKGCRYRAYRAMSVCD